MVLTSILIFGIIGLAAGIILAVAYGKLKVEEDPIVEKLSGALPGLNCGACGFASCHEYAEVLARGEADINLCRPGSEEVLEKIEAITGSGSSANKVKLKAVVRCGLKERKKSALYDAPGDCASMNLLGGGMACRYGCLGGGDCVRVCPFGAIELNENSLPVVDYNKCTGCGLCAGACPRGIIGLREPADGEIIYVGCMSAQPAKSTKSVCGQGCIGCRICERKAPPEMFKVEENLAHVEKQKPGVDIPSIKCPSGCIYVLGRNS